MKAMGSPPTRTHHFTHNVFTDATASVDHPWSRGLWLRNSSTCPPGPAHGSEGIDTPLPLLPAELLVLQLLNKLEGEGRGYL